MEQRFERTLFAARWLMTPMYLGLVLALGFLAIVFVRELAYYLPQVLTIETEDAILVMLTLIDLTLAGNLILIVMFSGYENFVSKFDFDPGHDRPAWMGKADFSQLKMKLIASIVAISAIDLLKWFMQVGETGETPTTWELTWVAVLHMVFVVSGVLMALMDFLISRSGKGH